MFLIDMLHGDPAPKRGDLFNTNVGDRRERTWIIIKVRRVKRKVSGSPPRYEVWAARWWELEVEMRLALWRSAERSGGQIAHKFYRYPKKKKKSFEQYMGSGTT